MLENSLMDSVSVLFSFSPTIIKYGIFISSQFLIFFEKLSSPSSTEILNQFCLNISFILFAYSLNVSATGIIFICLDANRSGNAHE
ncbi:MAG: hypothetical protein WCG25_02770 [bacterium]